MFILAEQGAAKMKFKGILLCTDLDGTLFRKDKSVSKENEEAIRYFKEEGGTFSFITGREPSVVGDVCELVKPNAPIGCLNGCGIYDYQKGRLLWSVALKKEAKTIVDAIAEMFPNIGIHIACADHVYFQQDNDCTQHFRDITGAPHLIANFGEKSGQVLKVVFASFDADELQRVKDALHGHPFAAHFDFVQSERTFYELLPKGASKGALLLKLAELLNIDRRKTIAVGDYDNDISMIRDAGIGYAVANAQPSAKAAANRVTVSNEEHAIAKIIEDLDLGRIKF